MGTPSRTLSGGFKHRFCKDDPSRDPASIMTSETIPPVQRLSYSSDPFHMWGGGTIRSVKDTIVLLRCGM